MTIQAILYFTFLLLLQGGESIDLTGELSRGLTGRQISFQLGLQKKKFFAPLLISRAEAKSQESISGLNSFSSANQKPKTEEREAQATKIAELGLSSSPSDKRDKNQSAKLPQWQIAENSHNQTSTPDKKIREVRQDLSQAESLKCEEFQRSEFETGYIEFSMPCSSSLFCFTSSEILRNYCKDDSRLVRYLCDSNQRNGWTTEVIFCQEFCRSGKCIGS